MALFTESLSMLMMIIFSIWKMFLWVPVSTIVHSPPAKIISDSLNENSPSNSISNGWTCRAKCSRLALVESASMIYAFGTLVFACFRSFAFQFPSGPVMQQVMYHRPLSNSGIDQPRIVISCSRVSYDINKNEGKLSSSRNSSANFRKHSFAKDSSASPVPKQIDF